LPRLLLFAACEKVLIDQDNNASLISLIQDLKVEIPETVDLPTSSAGGLPVVAMRWTALAMWLRTETDTDKEYEQRIDLIDPTGRTTGRASRTTFSFPEGKTTARNISVVLGFPVHASGRFLLRLWMRERDALKALSRSPSTPSTLTRGQPKA
jgi:hypothetical protein